MVGTYLLYIFLILFKANKIEIWIGPEECVETDNLSTQNYEYLGYITLNDNDGGSVKSRELKTITLPLASSTSYVKLILYENHKNSFNRFNQVCLLLILILKCIILFMFCNVGELDRYTSDR